MCCMYVIRGFKAIILIILCTPQYYFNIPGGEIMCELLPLSEEQVTLIAWDDLEANTSSSLTNVLRLLSNRSFCNKIPVIVSWLITVQAGSVLTKTIRPRKFEVVVHVNLDPVALQVIITRSSVHAILRPLLPIGEYNRWTSDDAVNNENSRDFTLTNYGKFNIKLRLVFIIVCADYFIANACMLCSYPNDVWLNWKWQVIWNYGIHRFCGARIHASDS